MKQKVVNPIEPSPASDNGHLALVNNLADATISTMSLFSYFRKNMVGRDSTLVTYTMEDEENLRVCHQQMFRTWN